MKKKALNTHYTGKQTGWGYELINGEYHIAPAYQEQFDSITTRKVAMGELLHQLIRHLLEDIEQIIKSERKIWESLEQDLGMPFTKEKWEYMRGVIKPETRTMLRHYGRRKLGKSLNPERREPGPESHEDNA